MEGRTSAGVRQAERHRPCPRHFFEARIPIPIAVLAAPRPICRLRALPRSSRIPARRPAMLDLPPTFSGLFLYCSPSLVKPFCGKMPLGEQRGLCAHAVRFWGVPARHPNAVPRTARSEDCARGEGLRSACVPDRAPRPRRLRGRASGQPLVGRERNPGGALPDRGKGPASGGRRR